MPVRIPIRWPHSTAFATAVAAYSPYGDRPGARHTAPSGRRLAVSLIVTSHNYGRYLEAAILSVLAQSHPAREILVVDDASTDDTRRVAERFAGEGVRYLRVDYRNVHRAREAGFRATAGDVVLFLDADNYLPRDYLRSGLTEFTHRNVGVVYADLQRFGSNGTSRTDFPEYSRGELMRGNFVDACALIRREAIEVCDAFSVDVDPMRTPEDYLLFQRLAQDGWEFRKQKSALMYRLHDEQKHVRAAGLRRREGYFATHCLQHHDVTLFIPLAGRDEAWDEQSRFLERQSWPHHQIRLILCDTSRRPEFSRRLRNWISECDYCDVRHFTFDAGRKGLADENRYDRRTERDVQYAMCRIYNRLRSALETDYCWILEDDVIPPDDVLERLLRHFRHDVATVCAPYASRWDPNYVVWSSDRRPHMGNGVIRARRPGPDEPQVTEVRGSGFGCLVARSQMIKDHIFTIPRGEPYYDPYFFRVLGDEWKRLCDWSCECRHLGFRGHGARR